ncbi:hypothetical protein OC835_001584 [Tilletia horrida]|nr:hypothetical protein OC835_001584 [Tilletia horrida]
MKASAGGVEAAKRSDEEMRTTALALRDRLLQGGTEVNAVGGGQDLLADPRFPVFLKGEGLAADPAFSGFFKHMGCGKETPAGPN